MSKNDSCLEDFKKQYSAIAKKHSLPIFDEMNKDFYIEKIAESETDYPLREIRKFVAEKISNYIRFVETLLSPSNVQMFVFAVVKNLSAKDKELLSTIYKKLAKVEARVIELDIEYNEEKEVAFIKDTNKLWNSIKKDLLSITDSINKNWDNKIETNGKGYFG